MNYQKEKARRPSFLKLHFKRIKKSRNQLPKEMKVIYSEHYEPLMKEFENGNIPHVLET